MEREACDSRTGQQVLAEGQRWASGLRQGEVALAVHMDWKGRGVTWPVFLP